MACALSSAKTHERKTVKNLKGVRVASPPRIMELLPLISLGSHWHHLGVHDPFTVHDHVLIALLLKNKSNKYHSP